jgi:hypothetical protein
MRNERVQELFFPVVFEIEALIQNDENLKIEIIWKNKCFSLIIII